MTPREKQIHDRLNQLVSAGKMIAPVTPDKADDLVFEALGLLIEQPKFLKAMVKVIDALPAQRKTAAQAVFAEGV